MSYPSDTTEDLLLKQISEIDHRISELEGEKRALQRVLQKVRQRNIATRDVTRKNSFNRILIENKILEVLREAGKAVSAQELFRKCVADSFGLKQSTFRSYLHRMKERGLIEVTTKRGWWQIGNQSRP